MKLDTIVLGCRQLVTLQGSPLPRTGADLSDLGVIDDGALAIRDGRLAAVGGRDEILAAYDAAETIDLRGRIVLPGFVDAHTHPVFVHTREDEFAQRLAGRSYVEIAQSGGGIRSTLRSTRAADEDLLFELARHRIRRMASQGTTTLEAKSGYGLDTASELKQLRVIERLNRELPVNVVPTFMGAHEFPPEYKDDHAAYLDLLCNEMIPAVTEQGIARFCDIFTEAHVFSIGESRRVLSCARDHGLQLKMHADEIEPIGGAELAAELGCVSADHLGAASDAGIAALKGAGVIPVLLPATLFSLRSHRYARGREMINRGLPVAIATDYNPGSCNCDSLLLTMSLACLQMGFSPSEALCAATISAAHAIGMGDEVGSLEVGKWADFTVWDIPSVNFLPFHLGSSHLEQTYIRGRLLTWD